MCKSRRLVEYFLSFYILRKCLVACICLMKLTDPLHLHLKQADLFLHLVLTHPLFSGLAMIHEVCLKPFREKTRHDGSCVVIQQFALDQVLMTDQLKAPTIICEAEQQKGNT